jgi:hypothetical protein
MRQIKAWAVVINKDKEIEDLYNRLFIFSDELTAYEAMNLIDDSEGSYKVKPITITYDK